MATLNELQEQYDLETPNEHCPDCGEYEDDCTCNVAFDIDDNFIAKETY